MLVEPIESRRLISDSLTKIDEFFRTFHRMNKSRPIKKSDGTIVNICRTKSPRKKPVRHNSFDRKEKEERNFFFPFVSPLFFSTCHRHKEKQIQRHSRTFTSIYLIQYSIVRLSMVTRKINKKFAQERNRHVSTLKTFHFIRWTSKKTNLRLEFFERLRR